MPPRVFDWHHDPMGAFLAAAQIRARSTRYQPGSSYREVLEQTAGAPAPAGQVAEPGAVPTGAARA
jgi:hypothetical protein